MNLDRVNNLINETKNNKFVQSFIKELQNYLEKNVFKNSYGNIEGDDISLINSIHNGNKITTKFRDQMYIERSTILNNYAKQTSDKGEMYYIYSQNSKLENGYNLCICEEGQSHTVIETTENDLPEGATVGSVLRKSGDDYILDNEATKEVSRQIEEMKDNLLEEQNKFLESKRIEGHIYELSENSNDRAWLLDVTDNSQISNEVIEEIDFPKELLKDAKEGDLFVYTSGKYQKYEK